MDQSPTASHHDSGNGYSEPAKKRRHRWIWAVVLLVFAGMFYWVLHQHAQSQEQAGAAPGAGSGGGQGQGGGGNGGGGGGGRRGAGGGGQVPITEATATLGDLGVYFNAIGTVTPEHTYTITSQVTGVITQVNFREGQYVKKGDPLIDIDSRQYAATLAQAQGTLARDQSQLAEAQMDLTRYQDAWQKNAIPRQTLEDQEKQVDIVKGTVQNDQATVDYDKVILSYCHIVAPFDGRVGLRLVDPGNLVTANSTTALGVLTQTQPITVIFTLAEDNLPQVLQQMKIASLEVDAFDRTQQSLLAKGKLATVDNQIDTTTGTVKLRALFSNSNGILFPNQFVNTRLLVKTLKNQLLLPSSAIQHNGDLSFVYVVQGNKVAMKTVTPGMTDGGNTVVAGLKPGDVVANSSFEKLQDGSQVYKSRVAIPGTTGDATASAKTQ
jgi:multidrug efflux system membrane fusion protein